MLEFCYIKLCKLLIIIGAVLCCQSEVCSQKRNFNLDPPNEKYAKDFMAMGNYVAAITEYSMLLKNDSTNFNYNHNLGICYLNSDINRKKAVVYLEKASLNPNNSDANVWYDLGRAYQYAYRFDDAIEAFSKFQNTVSGKNINQITPERQIEICNNAKEMIKNPVNVSFENLGTAVNSPFPDYNPYVSRDESTIIFNSRRKGNVGNLEDYDGYNTSDLYSTVYKYGSWKKAKRFTNVINTALVEEIVGMSSDGARIFVFFDNEFGRYEVYESKLSGKNFQSPVSLGSNVNISNKFISSATISRDKKTLFFAADFESKDGHGGLDIYMSVILPTGEWGPAVNLGDVVNTEYDDDFPHIGPDGKTLYFASMGHNTMGDYDIFKTVWNKENNSFSKPVNLGYPINTPQDNKVISFTSSGRYAYMHANRPDSYGDLDIYRLVFKDVEPVYSVINGYILTIDSNLVYNVNQSKFNHININTLDNTKHNDKKHTNSKNNNEIINNNDKNNNKLDIIINVYKKNNNSLYGTYIPDKRNSKYTIILPPGDFIVKVESNYFKNVTFDISIEDRDSRDIFIKQNIKLDFLDNNNKD